MKQRPSKSSGQQPRVREASALHVVMSGRKNAAHLPRDQKRERKYPKGFLRELQ